jgi:hypothetical protein
MAWKAMDVQELYPGAGNQPLDPALDHRRTLDRRTKTFPKNVKDVSRHNVKYVSGLYTQTRDVGHPDLFYMRRKTQVSFAYLGHPAAGVAWSKSSLVNLDFVGLKLRASTGGGLPSALSHIPNAGPFDKLRAGCGAPADLILPPIRKERGRMGHPQI